MALPRMTTTRPYVAAAHTAYPDSPISEHLIYGILKSGAVPHISAGKRLLFNADMMDIYLATGEPAEQPVQKYGKIRPVHI